MENLFEGDNLFKLACKITQDHKNNILKMIDEEKRAFENQDVEILTQEREEKNG